MSRAFESYDEAILLFNNKHYNACLNRFYYSCFYAVNALLISLNFSSSKHSGVRSLVNKELINSGKIPKNIGSVYNDLFELRQECDYKDSYNADIELVKPLIERAKAFIDFINNLL